MFLFNKVILLALICVCVMELSLLVCMLLLAVIMRCGCSNKLKAVFLAMHVFNRNVVIICAAIWGWGLAHQSLVPMRIRGYPMDFHGAKAYTYEWYYSAMAAAMLGCVVCGISGFILKRNGVVIPEIGRGMIRK